MMTTTLKSIGSHSLGKMYALMLGIISIFGAIPFGIFTMLTGEPLSGLLMMVGIPLGYMIAGYMSGVIAAVAYNFIANIGGGVEIELKFPRGIEEPMSTTPANPPYDQPPAQPEPVAQQTLPVQQTPSTPAQSIETPETL